MKMNPDDAQAAAIARIFGDFARALEIVAKTNSSPSPKPRATKAETNKGQQGKIPCY
jgi:hypothetical protein